MSYYKVLGLEKEPFSMSPDPGFLYGSCTHAAALNRLEIAIRLKRGMCLLLGDVGTGKTTLARALIQRFANETEFIFHIVLDPHYEERTEFISNLCRIFGLDYTYSNEPDSIEKYLYQKTVAQKKTVVLLVDEGQKLNHNSIEVLRVLLNYETNEFKLLQLIIMAQTEFMGKAGRIRNFMDRVALKHILNPLEKDETKKMIEYRLAHAGYKRAIPLFTEGAILEIYNYTKGYPRRIMNLCHQALEVAVMRDRKIIHEDMIRELVKYDVSVLNAVRMAEEPPERKAAVG